MTGDGGLVEVQATAERTPLSRASLDELLALAASGIERLRAAQQEAVGAAADVAVRLVLATRNEHKLRELDAADAPAPSSTRCPTRSSCRPRPAPPSPTTRSARRAPPPAPPGGPRSPTTPASRPPRSTAPRASGRRASPATTRPTRRTSPSCCARSRPTATPAWRTFARWPSSSRAGRSRSCTGAARAGSPTSRAAAAASATTPPSCPTTIPGDERTMAELDPEEKDAISHRGRAARALALRAGARRGAGAPARPARATCCERNKR